jgi:hypothetical protein
MGKVRSLYKTGCGGAAKNQFGKICDGKQESADYLKQRLIAFNMQQVLREGTLFPEPINIIIKELMGKLLVGLVLLLSGIEKDAILIYFGVKNAIKEWDMEAKFFKKLSKLHLIRV